MKQLNNDFCCDPMFRSITEDKIIGYELTDRTYDMPVTENSVRRLSFCPWCGVKLPKGLAKVYFDTLLKEYGITGPEVIRLEREGTLPDEFKTDEWWKKRGL